MRMQRFTPMLLVATLTVAGAAAAAGYGLTAPKRYDATAKLIVTPVAASDPTFAGFDLLRDAASAAALVRTPEVATAVRTQLGLRRSPSSLLHDVGTQVERDSNVVDVTAEDTGAVSAAQLANAFVDALIAQRTATFQSELSSALARTSDAALRRLQGRPDPTLHRASTALAPTSSVWPNVPVLVLGGAGVGLAAGSLLALALLGYRRRGREYAPLVTSRPTGPAVDALVDRLEQRLAARESALVARERDLQKKIDELRAAADALTEREQTLAERVAAVTRRELALARTPGVLAVAPVPEPVPAPPAATAASNGGFNLATLERLVGEHAAAHPGRVEEWESYLFFLRDFAAPDGALPHSFDALVEDTFGALLA
jgi:capsular polysaccharide biosynthesis protein